jgi:hypothetical protein
LEVPVVQSHHSFIKEEAMKTCPECGIAQNDEYQFCPEDGASLVQADSALPMADVSATRQTAGAVVLYCPACAAEYPLTFAVCPVHQTALTRHGIPTRVQAQAPPDIAERSAAKATTQGRLLHLVAADAPPRRSGLEEYEQTIESLARPAVAPAVADDIEEMEDVAPTAKATQDDGRRYRLAAMVISVTLALLALIGIYAVISNTSRKPAPTALKNAAKNNSPQPTITVQTPQAAVDYQEQVAASAPQSSERSEASLPRNDVASDSQNRSPRSVAVDHSPTSKVADARTVAAPREPAAAPPARPLQTVNAPRQPAATELVLPRGTFGLIEARLTGVRASRTASGYRYDLTFHMADQAGHATQWERLAIVTRAASGASRQQQLPFYHRLGADGTLSFTVSVEMPGRAPADWQGRIVCTSIGSDSSGKTYRASFGANVSPN